MCQGKAERLRAGILQYFDICVHPEAVLKPDAHGGIIKAMYEVRVQADFAAAHFLRDYHGKCEALHGHNYKVCAHVRGSRLDEGGMLLDFGVLKKSLRGICESLDHTNLNELSDSDGREVFAQNPSAERIARWIFVRLESLLNENAALKDGTFLYAVDVFETDTSRARYTAD